MNKTKRHIESIACTCTGLAFFTLLIGQKPTWWVPIFSIFGVIGFVFFIISFFIPTEDSIKKKADAYFNLGLAHENTNDFKEAYDAYKKSNELWPTDTRKQKLNKIKI